MKVKFDPVQARRHSVRLFIKRIRLETGRNYELQRGQFTGREQLDEVGRVTEMGRTLARRERPSDSVARRPLAVLVENKAHGRLVQGGRDGGPEELEAGELVFAGAPGSKGPKRDLTLEEGRTAWRRGREAQEVAIGRAPEVRSEVARREVAKKDDPINQVGAEVGRRASLVCRHD